MTIVAERLQTIVLFEAITLTGKALPASGGSSCSTCPHRRHGPLTKHARESEQSTANTSHHPQALHAAGMAGLPADRGIVAYCRGPFCAYAHDAVRTLDAAGRAQHSAWTSAGTEWRLADAPERKRRAA